MPSKVDTADILERFLKARVPLIVLRTIEGTRGLDLLKGVASKFRAMPFYYHSRATGLFDITSPTPVIDDRSFVGALDFATATFSGRNNANFILTDVDDIETDSSSARHLAEISRLAETHQGSIIVIASGPVWSGLARLGMSVALDLPDASELYTDVVKAYVDDHRAVMRIEWEHEEMRLASEALVGVTETEAINAITTMLARGSLLKDDLSELSVFKDQIFGELSGIERVKLKENDYQVGGLTTLREWLTTRRELIRADLSGTHLHPPKGVLLVGVPGCGKSLSAKAIAAEWKLPLYRLDMASILGMYVGVSESRLKEALDTADRIAPCILWVDEIEKALAGGNSDSGTTTRLIGQFLFWLQESTSKVFMVATANDVSALPPELLRKGRFDELFFVDLPDELDRSEIICLYFRKYLQVEPTAELLAALAELSEGFAGSDIESVVHDIAAAMFMQHRDTPPGDEYIKDVFANVMPFSRTNPEEVAAIRAWGRDRAIPAGRSTPLDARQASATTSRRLVILS
ncbi:MAG: AAA family ATPase [Rhodococcus sp. (in: high G+C Gram-positive bacteria)]